MTDHTHIPPAAPDPLPPHPTEAPTGGPTDAPTDVSADVPAGAAGAPTPVPAHASTLPSAPAPPLTPAHEPVPPPIPPPAPPLDRSRARRWGVVAGVAVLLVAVLFMLGRRAALTPAPTSGTRSPAAPVVESSPLPLAETTGEEGHLTIGVVSLDRVAADTVELRLAVTNTNRPGSPALDIAQRFSADGPDRGTLAEVYLADLSHEHKFFVLRDGANVPLGSRDLSPLAAGERRVLWARYPAPGDSDVEVVVHVPHAEPLPNVPVGQKRAEP